MKDTAATCTDNEKGHYIADFTNPVFVSQSTAKDSVEKPETLLQHNFAEPAYIWEGDRCTASRVCINDGSHVETETATGIYTKDTDATYTDNEKGHYIADFTNPAFVSQSTAKDSVEKTGTVLTQENPSGEGGSTSGEGGSTSGEGGSTSGEGGSTSGEGGNTSGGSGNTSGGSGNTSGEGGNTSGGSGNFSGGGQTGDYPVIIPGGQSGSMQDGEGSGTSDGKDNNREDNKEDNKDDNTDNNKDDTGDSNDSGEPENNDGKKTENKTVRKGDSFNIGKGRYIVTNVSKQEVGYTCPNADSSVTAITIPSYVKIRGKYYKVTSISSGAFKGFSNLTTVKIGNNIKRIPAGLFKNFKTLKKVTIGRNVRSIGKKAFYGCKNLRTVIVHTKLLKNNTVVSSAFTGLYKKAVIRVPKAVLNSYKKLLKRKGINGKYQKIR